MSTTGAPSLFEDVFEVTDVDPDGKKFDRGLSTMFPRNAVGCFFHNGCQYLA